MLVEHLRGDLQQLLGGSDSASVVMRLGNAQEASAAAEYIGRGYSFKLTQLSQQTGRTDTTGRSYSSGSSGGWSESSGRSGGRAGTGWSDSATSSVGWSTQEGTSESTAWSKTDGETATRVYEFTVEPTQIQSLPAAAFIVVESVAGGRRVVAGSCDPRIVTLAGVAADEYQGDGSPSPGPDQGGAAETGETASVFIVDPAGQLDYMAESLARAGYQVQREDIPGQPMKCGWHITHADGSLVSTEDVLRHR